MNKKTIIFLACLSLLTSACDKNKSGNLENNTTTNEAKNINDISSDYLISNINDDKSIAFVKNSIEKNLNKKNSEVFIDLVKDYNKEIPDNLLYEGFSKNLKSNYDLGKIIQIRDKVNHKYLDTNCRINTFILIKDDLSLIEKTNIDDTFLFMDKSSIENLKLFNEDDYNKFLQLFSRVKTTSSKKINDQAKVMSEFLSNFNFPKNAEMISVVIHDNLDGDFLFIGHVGILLPIDDGYLFLEKISFEEPYQAIKFLDKKSCFKYLKNKYKDYTDPEVCPPFIMENNKYVEI